MGEPERKRRLPLLAPSSRADLRRSRPRWQWLLLGMGLIAGAWLPVAVLSRTLMAVAARRWLAPVPSTGHAAANTAVALARPRHLVWLWALSSLVGLALGAVLGGLALGWWAGRAGARQAAWAGAGVTVLAVAAVGRDLVAAGGAPLCVATLLLATTVAAGGAHAGARLGASRGSRAAPAGAGAGRKRSGDDG